MITRIAGKDNSNCDRLSRREDDEPSVSVQQMAEEMSIGGTRVVELNSQETAISILRMCNPKIVLATESDFIFWKKTRSAISDFLTLYPTSLAPAYGQITNPVSQISTPPTPISAHTPFLLQLHSVILAGHDN
jgi:hypothetical protein